MSLGQLSSRGKQNNKLYLIQVSIILSIENRNANFFINFYCKQKIESSSELFNYLKNNGYNTINHLPVNGSGYISNYRIFSVYYLYYSNINPNKISFRTIFYDNINGETTASTIAYSSSPSLYTIKCFEVI